MKTTFRGAVREKYNNAALFFLNLREQTRVILHKRIGAATLLVFAVLIGGAVALNSLNVFLIEIDGRANFFVSMRAGVEAVLAENGYTVGEYDLLEGDDSVVNGFASARLERRYPVTIFADGQSREVYSTHGETVLAALSGAGIQLRALDQVRPSIMEMTRIDMLIEVTEVSLEHNAIDTQAVLLAAEEQLRIEEERLEKEKQAAEKAHNQAKQYMAGNTVSPIVYKPAVSLLPVEQEENVLITREGTFKYIAKFDGECTAYCSGTHTATGTPVRVGLVAVDPKVIPLKSKLYILAADGTSWMYGYAVAEDTGGAVKGNIVDLYMPDYGDCINFGRRKATIYILE